MLLHSDNDPPMLRGEEDFTFKMIRYHLPNLRGERIESLNPETLHRAFWSLPHNKQVGLNKCDERACLTQAYVHLLRMRSVPDHAPHLDRWKKDSFWIKGGGGGNAASGPRQDQQRSYPRESGAALYRTSNEGLEPATSILRTSAPTNPIITHDVSGAPKTVDGWRVPEKIDLPLEELTLSKFKDFFWYVNPRAPLVKPWEALLQAYKLFVLHHHGADKIDRVSNAVLNTNTELPPDFRKRFCRQLVLDTAANGQGDRAWVKSNGSTPAKMPMFRSNAVAGGEPSEVGRSQSNLATLLMRQPAPEHGNLTATGPHKNAINGAAGRQTALPYVGSFPPPVAGQKRHFDDEESLERISDLIKRVKQCGGANGSDLPFITQPLPESAAALSAAQGIKQEPPSPSGTPAMPARHEEGENVHDADGQKESLDVMINAAKLAAQNHAASEAVESATQESTNVSLPSCVPSRFASGLQVNNRVEAAAWTSVPQNAPAPTEQLVTTTQYDPETTDRQLGNANVNLARLEAFLQGALRDNDDHLLETLRTNPGSYPGHQFRIEALIRGALQELEAMKSLQ